MDNLQAFNCLRKEIKSCSLCYKKFGFRPRPYFWGEPNSKIVQVSQAPSKKVHYSEKPFDDISGKRLREWYGIDKKTFYDKRIFYMTSLSHCYPGKNKKGKDNPPPSVCAKKYLSKELLLVNNKIYIIIGRMAAKFLFPDKDFSELVVNRQKLNKKPTHIIPHPSPQNIKWLKEHPEFYEVYLPKLKKAISKIIKDVKNNRLLL